MFCRPSARLALLSLMSLGALVWFPSGVVAQADGTDVAARPARHRRVGVEVGC